MSKGDVHAREADATIARERFMTTLHALQRRFSPKTITTDIIKEIAKEKADGAINAAKDGMVHAATHPSTVAAIAVPLLVYLFRKPIARGLGSVLGNDEAESPEAEAAPNSVRSKQGV